MQKLIDGLHLFQSQVFESQKALFEELAKGQKPEVLFVTCSDSRINPNLLTQTRPGDLFIVRNAGNIVPPYSAQSGGEQATIEYGVAVLGVQHIVVCGHSLCGAMKAVAQNEDLSSLPSVQHWLSHAQGTRQIMRDHYAHLKGDALLTATVEENVLAQLEHLQTHPAVRSAARKGKLALHGWVYKMETGKVFQYDHKERQFLPLDAALNNNVIALPELVHAEHLVAI